jgi:hypothetical protein
MKFIFVVDNKGLEFDQFGMLSRMIGQLVACLAIE